jgi:hypothetical protein
VRGLLVAPAVAVRDHEHAAHDVDRRRRAAVAARPRPPLRQVGLDQVEEGVVVEQGRRLAERIERFLPLVDRAIAQATRRVLRDEAVPAGEKILSLFEPHTQAIRRHKPGKPTEFGRKVLLDEVDGGIVSHYAILS